MQPIYCIYIVDVFCIQISHLLAYKKTSFYCMIWWWMLDSLISLCIHKSYGTFIGIFVTHVTFEDSQKWTTFTAWINMAKRHSWLGLWWSFFDDPRKCRVILEVGLRKSIQPIAYPCILRYHSQTMFYTRSSISKTSCNDFIGDISYKHIC